MTRAIHGIALLLALGAGIAACGSSQPHPRTHHAAAHGDGQHAAVEDHGRCDTTAANLEVSEYDTSGDSTPDVRRVFRRVGDPPVTRLVLACREADLNGDGTKDVVRYYNDEGRPLREEADRNFDGTLDTIRIFQDGRVVREEMDENGDGRVDSKTYFDDDGSAMRTERDIAGRSTATDWHPDRWEYYENGRMVRMGTDLDGDGRVDRWDRDHDYSPAPDGAAPSTGTAAAPSTGAAVAPPPPTTTGSTTARSSG